jgi:hypothetical protein
MPYIHKEKKSQEKMYVVVDLNHAGPKLLNQLHSAIQEKKDNCVLRFQNLDSGYAVIYLKDLNKIGNLNFVKNNHKNNEQRQKINGILRESIKNCEKSRDFVSDIDFECAIKNINELVNLRNHDIKVSELRRPLRVIADAVSSPLKRKKLAEIKKKNKIRSSIAPQSQKIIYLHLKRFLNMDEMEIKNLYKFLNERVGDLEGKENNVTASEIKSMQKFITAFVHLDDLDTSKLLNRFSRSKSMIEVENFCLSWLAARRSDAELTHRMKSELFGWRKEMDFIAINIVNRNANSEVKKINRAEINSKNLLVPPISPLGREVFKVGGKNHSSAIRNEKSDERTEANKISRVLNFSLQDNEESSIVESSEQSNAGNI